MDGGMKACVLKKPFELVIDDVEQRQPADDEVLIGVKAAGICGSDLHAYRGTHPFRKPPIISGHEFSGRVEAVGRDVRKVRSGEPVTVEPWTHCGMCAYCSQGKTNLCLDKVAMGTSDWPGCFAEYVVAPENVVYKLPENVSYEIGALIEPLAASMHAVRRVGVESDETAVIFGAGAIGLGILICLCVTGITRVVVTDVVDFNLDVAKKLGATAAVNVKQQSIREEVENITGGKGADIVFIAAGVGSLMQEAVEVAGKDGRISVPAIFDAPVEIDMFKVVFAERNLHGSWAYTRKDFEIIIDLLTLGKIDPLPLITHRFALDEAAKALQIFDARSENAIKMLFRFE
jgi:L-iditol 2-dehydrogenase